MKIQTKQTALVCLYGQRMTFQEVILLWKVRKQSRDLRQVSGLNLLFSTPKKATDKTHQDGKNVFRYSHISCINLFVFFATIDYAWSIIDCRIAKSFWSIIDYNRWWVHHWPILIKNVIFWPYKVLMKGVMWLNKPTPQQYVADTHFVHLGGERLWSKVSCLRKQHDGRDWASNHLRTEVQHVNHYVTVPPQNK